MSESTRFPKGLGGFEARHVMPLCVLLAACLLTLGAIVAKASGADSSSPSASLSLASEPVSSPTVRGIWRAEVGGGFRSDTESVSVGVGASSGFAGFGSHQAHDLALASCSYGHMLGGVVGGWEWYRGNFEWRVELFAGAQFSPENDWLVGLTPHLRYHFATGTRWIPFLDAGAGVTATEIGPPDLSNTFEFNLQGGGGVQYFLRDNVALTFEARYIHLSCAGISQPNDGVNTVLGMVGLTWYF